MVNAAIWKLAGKLFGASLPGAARNERHRERARCSWFRRVLEAGRRGWSFDGRLVASVVVDQVESPALIPREVGEPILLQSVLQYAVLLSGGTVPWAT